MGHGDDLIISCFQLSSGEHGRRLVRMPGLTSRVLETVLTMMPLDGFVEDPCARIEVVGNPDAVPEV